VVGNKGLGTASAAAATGCPVGFSGVVLCDVSTGRASSTPRARRMVHGDQMDTDGNVGGLPVALPGSQSL